MNRQRNFYSVRKRICRKLLAALLIIGIPVLLFLFTFSIRRVAVTGATRYTNKQIKEMVLKTGPDHNSVYLFLKYKFFKTPSIPFIEKIDVEMVNNHTVSVNVYEKSVAGCIEFMGEYFYFDKDGIIVESSSKKIENVPIIKGLKFNQIILHEKLRIQRDDLYKVILNITKLIDKYDLDVDTISFSSDYEVTLESNGIQVLLGRQSSYYEALSDLKSILAKAKGADLAEIDMRNYNKETGYVIGKPKNSTE